MTAATAERFRDFKMPDVGEGLTEAEILKWYVQPGDTVTDGQVVCEVETAKAAVELPIPFDGTVHELCCSEGTTVDVGTVIITVDTGRPAGAAGASEGVGAAADAGPQGAEGASAPGRNGPDAPDAPDDPDAPGGGQTRTPVLVGYGVSVASTKRRPRKPQSGPAPAEAAPRSGSGSGAGAGSGQRRKQVPAQGAAEARTEAAGSRSVTPALGAVPAEAGAAAAAAAGTGRAARPLAKPPVRKLAKDLGLDLTGVTPTGPDGVITRDDVRAAAEEARTAATAAAPPAVLPAVTELPVRTESPSAAREHRTPVKGVRKAIAQAMVTSAFTAPHATEFVTVDVTRTMKLVRELKEDPDLAGLRVNPLLLVAKAFLVAIRRNPAVNSAWDEENQEIVHKDYVNLGIATATPRGLLVPNIKDAGRMTLPELSAALGELVETARGGKTPPADMQDGTVTITNIGVFGVDTGTPILNPGESAILAFGAIRPQPWVHKGKVKPRQVTTLALSFDHRLVDGELGSRVLADIAAVLERPRRLITWS